MTKTNYLIISLVIVVIGVLFWLGRPAQKAVEPAMLINSSGILSADVTAFDFGTISMAAGEVSHQFTVKNISDQPAMVNRIYTSCMCTTAILVKGGEKFGPFGMPGHGFIPPVNETINAGEEAIIEITFDPAAHGPAGIGRIQRIVAVESGEQSLEFSFTASVTP